MTDSPTRRSLFPLFAPTVLLLALAVAIPAGAQTQPETDAPDNPDARLAAPDVASLDALDFPILFAKQNNYQGLHIYDAFFQHRPGGGIYVLENPAAPPEERKIRPIIDATTPETLGEGVYSDPDLSYDATKIVFCFKGAPNACTSIWEIGVDGKNLRRVTDFDFETNEYRGSGAGLHDVQPSYLPDGRIVFASTRYCGLVPCANNGVALLHTVDADGSDLRTISVNNVTEFDPTVLDDGRILFGRWEYIDKNALTIQSLWTVYPDGTNETALFANNMVFPESILQARQVPGRPDLIVGTFAAHNGPPRGAIALIDVSGDKNDENAIFNFEYPDVPTFDRGQSCDPWPLNENLVLYSGIIGDKLPTARPTDPASPERIGAVLPQPKGVYNSILLIDRAGNRVEVLRDSEIDLHSPIPLVPRPTPRLSPETVDRTQNTGSFFVSDVYKGLEGVERGTVKWLRVVEETSRVSASPGTNGLNQTFSISAALAWSPKNYLGIVPVEPNGSVFFEAPSGRALSFQLLDGDYRLVRSMRTFIQAAPGAARSCVGCHEYGPPELTDAGAARYPKGAAQKLRDESWGSGYLDYPSQIQPIWDVKCVRCHGGERLEAGLDLSGAPTRAFSVSYENLTSRRRNQYQVDLIAGVCCMNGTAYYSCKFFAPYEIGSGAAPLADLLLNDPIHKDLLTAVERELVFAWIDSNGLYFGTWDYTASGPILAPWDEAKRELVALMQAPESGCVECHSDGNGVVRRFENDWINLFDPESSRILRAPLVKPDNRTTSDEPSNPNATGLALCRRRPFPQNFLRLGIMSGGQYEHAVKELRMFPTQEWRAWDESGDPAPVFESTSDPTYRKMLAIIRSARDKAFSNPRIDMPNASDAPGGIVEGRPRQIVPQPIPEQEVAFDASVGEDGVVRLTWERSTRAIGLVFELRRAASPDFPPDETELLTRTTRFEFVDKTAPAGNVHYRLTPISDPTLTCGTFRLSAQNRADAARFPIVRGKPLDRAVVVPESPTPAAPTNLAATSEVERVSLSWDANADFGTVRYLVERQAKSNNADAPNASAPTSVPIALTPTPICGTTFVDESGEPGVEYRYSVKAVSRKGFESSPAFVDGESIPAPKTELFVVDFRTGSDASVDDGAKVVSPQTLGTPTFEDDAVALDGNAYFLYPNLPQLNVKRRFTLAFDVRFDAPGEMPVVVSFGRWNESGWFLQNFNGKLRFHFGGIDCDATSETPIGRWFRVVATFDGEKLTLTRDGETIAEKVCRPSLKDWTGPLCVGQYSAEQASPYRFAGRIRNLEILNFVR